MGKLDYTFKIAGTSHYQTAIKKIMNSPDFSENHFVLKRDPENEFDKYAIQVVYCFDDRKEIVGFIPRTYSKTFATKYDNYVPIAMQFIEWNVSQSHTTIGITIRVKEI